MNEWSIFIWLVTEGGASLTHGRFAEDVARKMRRTDSLSPSPSPSPVASPVPLALPANNNNDSLPFNMAGFSHSAVASLASSLANFAALHGSGAVTSSPFSKGPAECLIRDGPLALVPGLDSADAESYTTQRDDPIRSRKLVTGSSGHLVAQGSLSNCGESRRTIWKCKRCVFK